MRGGRDLVIWWSCCISDLVLSMLHMTGPCVRWLRIPCVCWSLVQIQQMGVLQSWIGKIFTNQATRLILVHGFSFLIWNFWWLVELIWSDLGGFGFWVVSSNLRGFRFGFLGSCGGHFCLSIWIFGWLTVVDRVAMHVFGNFEN